MLDRMLGVLGALLEENIDTGIHLQTSEFSIPGEEAGVEMSRVAVYAAIIRAVDWLDGPPTFWAAVRYEMTVWLARESDVSFRDLFGRSSSCLD